MKKFGIYVVAIMGIAIMLSGCETLKGAGKDIENTGHNIQKIFTGE